MSPRGRVSPTHAYRRAQLAARRDAGRLSDAAVGRIRKTIAEEADRFAAGVAALPIGRRERDIGDRAAALTRRLADRIGKSTAKAVGEARGGAFATIAEVWQDSAREIAEARDIPGRLLGALASPPVTLLGAYESLGGAGRTWRASLGLATSAAAADLDAIVRAGIAQQIAPDALAARLRTYVRGGAPATAFAGPEFAELRRMLTGRADDVRGAAAQLAYRTKRIAFSEVHNARAEAEVLHFAFDPFVGAVRWELSPFRGSQVTPDECDFYAGTDLYGLGIGIFPVDAVPLPPHPFDRCERFPVPRPVDQANMPKRTGLTRRRGFTTDDIPRWAFDTLTERQATRILAHAEASLAVSEAAASVGPLSRLIDDGLAAIPGFGEAIAKHRAALGVTRPPPDVVLPPPPAPPPVDVPALTTETFLEVTGADGVVYRVPRSRYLPDTTDAGVKQWIEEATRGDFNAQTRLFALENAEALGVSLPALRAELEALRAVELLSFARRRELDRAGSRWGKWFDDTDDVGKLDSLEWDEFRGALARLEAAPANDTLARVETLWTESDTIAKYATRKGWLEPIARTAVDDALRIERAIALNASDAAEAEALLTGRFDRLDSAVKAFKNRGVTFPAYITDTLEETRRTLEILAAQGAVPAVNVDALLAKLEDDFRGLATDPRVETVRRSYDGRIAAAKAARDAAEAEAKAAIIRASEAQKAFYDVRPDGTYWDSSSPAARAYGVARLERDKLTEKLRALQNDLIRLERAAAEAENTVAREMLLDRFGNVAGETNGFVGRVILPAKGDIADASKPVLAFLDRLIAKSTLDVAKLGPHNTLRIDGRKIARGHYMHSTRTIKLSDRGGRGISALAEVAAHEVGHYVEYMTPGALTRSKQWVAVRGGSEKPKSLQRLFPGHGYARHEVAVVDQFITPYIGKEYPDATEVMSMGLEYLWTNPREFLAKDRDMFRHVISIIRGI